MLSPPVTVTGKISAIFSVDFRVSEAYCVGFAGTFYFFRGNFFYIFYIDGFLRVNERAKDIYEKTMNEKCEKALT